MSLRVTTMRKTSLQFYSKLRLVTSLLILFGIATTRGLRIGSLGTPQRLNPPTSLSRTEPSPLPAQTSPKSFQSNNDTPPSKTRLSAWPLTKDPKGVPPDYPLAAARLSITAFATILTWYTHAYSKKCGAVLASSAVTLLGSLAAPGLGQAAMCGSFAGMSGAGLIPGWGDAIWLGSITAVLFEILIHYRNAYLGVGGRLGAAAFIGANAFAVVKGVPVIAASHPSVTSFAAGLSASPLALMTGFSALGSVATIALREASDDKAAADPVRAAALVGLLSALLVGIGGFTETGALAAYGGAFAGMSLPSRLMKGIIPGKKSSEEYVAPSVFKLLASFAIAGALGGIVHGITLGWGFWLGGWGGKAGSCAFAGVLIYRGLEKITKVLRK